MQAVQEAVRRSSNERGWLTFALVDRGFVQERKMKMKRILFLALALGLGFVVGTAVWAVAAEKDAERVIRVATPGNYAPFTIFDEATQEWSGFEIEFWHIVGEKSGYDIQFVRLDNPATFAELDLGRVDTVAKQISITPARQQKYDFTQPFFFSPYCLTVRESNEDVKSWKDMEGKSIGLAEGSAMNEFIAALDPENKVKKSTYESGGILLQEVAAGRVDAVPFAYLILPWRLKKNPELKLKSVDAENPIYVEVNAYPFARTDRGRALLKLTDDVLTQMIEDGSYAKLCEKWFGMNVMDSKYAKEYREKTEK